MILLTLALATADMRPITAYGVGRASCATAMARENYSDSFNWVMGYFSGRNQEGPVSVGGTDGAGIMGEIKLICDARPSEDLFDAAHQVYERLRTRQRTGL